jgi:hypothetical protein
MAPTPRPAGWKGGSEDFGFLRTYDGHIATDRTGGTNDPDLAFGYANVRWGFENADLNGTYSSFDVHEDREDRED